MINAKYIIVGQGIAGTLLSFFMSEKNISHVVISDRSMDSASDISAGMMNPLVFKRITKSWNADTFLPFAKDIYSKIEKKLNGKYLKDFKIAKVLTSEDEVNWWKQRIESQTLQHYFEGFSEKELIDHVQNAHKFAVIKQAAHVNVSSLINDYRKLLNQNQSLINHKFDYNKLVLSDNKVEYEGIKADKIIFCEGAHIIHNSYFNFIPFYLTRGDLLKVDIQNFQKDYILTKNKFLLPVDEHFVFGSTYIRTENSLARNDEDQRNKLLKELRLLLDKPFEVKQHLYGVRPTIKDRRPVLGLHPRHNQLAVFNGLGTKGTMLGPYHAHLMLEFLLGNINEIEQEISLVRFG